MVSEILNIFTYNVAVKSCVENILGSVHLYKVLVVCLGLSLYTELTATSSIRFIQFYINNQTARKING